MHKLHFTTLLLTVFLLLSLPLFAQLEKPNYEAGSSFPTNRRGLDGITIEAVVVHNNQLFVAATSGLKWVVVMKSDNGRIWQQCDQGISEKARNVGNAPLIQLVDLQSVGNMLFLVISQEGKSIVYTSKNNGTSWKKQSQLIGAARANWTFEDFYRNGKINYAASTLQNFWYSSDGNSFQQVRNPHLAGVYAYNFGAEVYTHGSQFAKLSSNGTLMPVSNVQQIAGDGSAIMQAIDYSQKACVFLFTASRFRVGKITGDNLATFQTINNINYPQASAYVNHVFMGSEMYVLRRQHSGAAKTILEKISISPSSDPTIITGGFSKVYEVNDNKNQKLDIVKFKNKIYWITWNAINPLNANTLGDNILKTAQFALKGVNPRRSPVRRVPIKR